ncbi:hypothetical protein [Phenylobacterium zucineum]|uniref:hypothetical protein n=1 Tax=Phenylobacterium zucineum TaxID=284016 RepID=UPI000317E47A|nr:hypothetical protein [Phenylobacterium zucineum]
MPQLKTDPALRPFSESGYEILDEELDTRREVAIWSVDPLAPRLGDLFTVESRGVVHEVAVVQLATFKGGWSAVCRVTDVF